jgi:2-C-methyl-D-erythritol 4-phosphate cytidylyltransferase / 2-C-methyl-D-erythritol 2,4-cyclodiphosphate synthase
VEAIRRCADHRAVTAGTKASLDRDSRIDAMKAQTSPHAPRLFALVPCAGVGLRAGAAGPKQYAHLAGRALVSHTLRALLRVARLQAVLVVLADDDALFEQAVPEFSGPLCWWVRRGGATRAQTVANGLNALRERGADDNDWVLVHDAARALIQPQWIDRLIDECLDDDVGGLLALPLADTLKAERDGRSAATVDRTDKWAAQTPQMFRIGVLRDALARAGDAVTDEASAIEASGLRPRLVMGDATNIKVTWPEDLARAQALLAVRDESAEAGTTGASSLRVGEGWDVHALVVGRPLVLGGVTIPHSHGLLAHSDGDALLHAIIDAMFGAAALGDIGRHFPDTDEAFRGADSIVLLRAAGDRVRAAGYRIGNIDSTIIAQAPKLAPYIEAMRERVASALALGLACVNVKAKTAEKMGPVGEGRAIEARAVCLLVRP